MRAENVPQAKTPVVTFWEGDIIDNVNHSFITSKWGADKKIDVKHWPRFDGFQPLRRQVQSAGGRCAYKQQKAVSTPCLDLQLGMNQLLLHCQAQHLHLQLQSRQTLHSAASETRSVQCMTGGHLPQQLAVLFPASSASLVLLHVHVACKLAHWPCIIISIYY